ncbi:MAG: glycosyltransferase [Lachnospiraceae bacterium]|nr:glycosyltransferase [Lachnospiraceae bacterium]
MNTDKIISIVVPVYNVEKYLPNGLDHIINQTYKNLEIILVDDGSTDNSGNICDEYAAKDSRIKVIHKPNGGSSSARNVGIEAATGDYIGFLDADDYADETMYEKLIAVCEEKNCDIAEVMSRDFDESGKMIKDAYKNTGEVNFIPRDEDFKLLMLHKGDSSFCTKLIRAEFCKDFRFSEKLLNEDFRLILEMLQETDGVWSIEEPHYNILIRKGSNQRSGFKRELYEAVIANSDYAYSLMEDFFPQWEEETDRFRYVQRLDYLLHIPVKQMTERNECYQKVIKEIRDEKNIWQNNKYLTAKQKKNLTILSIAPKLSKKAHKALKKIKKARK